METSIFQTYLQHALGSRKGSIWWNRSLLPEAARTRPGNFRMIKYKVRQQCTSSTVIVVCPPSDHCWGLFRKSTGRFSAVAPLRKFSQYGTATSPRVAHHFPLGTPNYRLLFWIQNLPTIIKASTTLVSARGTPATQVCVGMDMLSADCSHAAKSNTTGRRRWRNAVRCPPVVARAQLNVSDDMTPARKNAHSSSTALSDTVMPLGWSLALQ